MQKCTEIRKTNRKNVTNQIKLNKKYLLKTMLQF